MGKVNCRGLPSHAGTQLVEPAKWVQPQITRAMIAGLDECRLCSCGSQYHQIIPAMPCMACTLGQSGMECYSAQRHVLLANQQAPYPLMHFRAPTPCNSRILQTNAFNTLVLAAALPAAAHGCWRPYTRWGLPGCALVEACFKQGLIVALACVIPCMRPASEACEITWDTRD